MCARYKPADNIGELKKKLSSLPDSQLSITKNEMLGRGFKNPSRNQLVVYYWVGERLFSQLLNISFNYSCIEANLLHINYQNEHEKFRNMNLNNLEELFESIIDQLANIAKQTSGEFDFKKINFEVLSDRDIREKIKKKRGLEFDYKERFNLKF